MKNNSLKTREKLPAIDFAKCRKCNKCIEACPAQAILEYSNNCCAKCIKYCITMEVPCRPEHITFSYERCDLCGLCVTSCPENAIYWFVPTTAEVNTIMIRLKK